MCASAIHRCRDCGAIVDTVAALCPRCGGSVDVNVTIEGASMEIRPGRLGVVNEQRHLPGRLAVDYSAPSGARSRSEISREGMSATVAGPVDTGTRGEARVIDVVMAVLHDAGIPVDRAPGDDRSGEDHLLTVRGEEVIFQIVTVPHDKAFWRQVAVGTADSELSMDDTIALIDKAILEKAQYDAGLKRKMLLALDVAHLAVLTTPDVVAAYVQHYGDPAQHGIAAVWLIGPTLTLSARLGASRW